MKRGCAFFYRYHSDLIWFEQGAKTLNTPHEDNVFKSERQHAAFKYRLPVCLCIHALARFRVICTSKTHKCAVSIKSQWASQVLLIFHQGYSWINAFKVLLKDQFHDLFRYKTVRHVADDVRVMWDSSQGASIVEAKGGCGDYSSRVNRWFNYSMLSIKNLYHYLLCNSS